MRETTKNINRFYSLIKQYTSIKKKVHYNRMYEFEHSIFWLKLLDTYCHILLFLPLRLFRISKFKKLFDTQVIHNIYHYNVNTRIKAVVFLY